MPRQTCAHAGQRRKGHKGGTRDLVIGKLTWFKVRDIIAAIHSGSIRLHSLSVSWATLYPGLEGKLESACLTGNCARVHYGGL
jgi:hypothetical protein